MGEILILNISITGSKGMIQDKQNPYPAGFTVGMSITLMDRISGPFQVSFAFLFDLNPIRILEILK
jgi:hypothetical protein